MDAHSEERVVIGDNMRTDILAGVQAGIETILVLTGVGAETDPDEFPFRPNRVYGSVAEIEEI